jgi:hypothetical protein
VVYVTALYDVDVLLWCPYMFCTSLTVLVGTCMWRPCQGAVHWMHWCILCSAGSARLSIGCRCKYCMLSPPAVALCSLAPKRCCSYQQQVHNSSRRKAGSQLL